MPHAFLGVIILAAIAIVPLFLFLLSVPVVCLFRVIVVAVFSLVIEGAPYTECIASSGRLDN